MFKYRTITDTTPKFLINIETVTALANLNAIIDATSDILSGILFGRVDFTLSSNLTRADISGLCRKSALHVSGVCKSADLQFVLGGGVSIDSIDFQRLSDVRLDRFETRKCILSPESLFTVNIELLQDCVLAELLWLKAKSFMYNSKQAKILIVFNYETIIYGLNLHE